MTTSIPRAVILFAVTLTSLPDIAVGQTRAGTTARIDLIPEFRQTIQSVSNETVYGLDAKMYGLRIEGPGRFFIRPWVTAARAKLGITCIANASCDNTAWHWSGGIMLDAAAGMPEWTLQPYLAVGAGTMTGGTHDGWFLTFGAGTSLRLADRIGIRAGAVVGEEPLGDRRFMMEIGLRFAARR